MESLPSKPLTYSTGGPPTDNEPVLEGGEGGASDGAFTTDGIASRSSPLLDVAHPHHVAGRALLYML